MDAYYTLSIRDKDGRTLASRVVRLPGNDTQSEEHGVGRTAKELYRDLLRGRGDR